MFVVRRSSLDSAGTPVQWRGWVGLVAVVALGWACGTGCTADPPFDRDATVQRVVADGGGRFTTQQAECYVDRAADQLGSGVLTPDATLAAPQLDRLTVIRIDCAGVASLGRTPGTELARKSEEIQRERQQPMKKGEDVQLDLLWDSCERGSGESCDRLFEAAPVGSEYEVFGQTCGNRTKELRCADRYAGMAASGTTISLP